MSYKDSLYHSDLMYVIVGLGRNQLMRTLHENCPGLYTLENIRPISLFNVLNNTSLFDSTISIWCYAQYWFAFGDWIVWQEGYPFFISHHGKDKDLVDIKNHQCSLYMRMPLTLLDCVSNTSNSSKILSHRLVGKSSVLYIEPWYTVLALLL